MWNRYVATAAATEAEARAVIIEACHLVASDLYELVHTEPAEEYEEQPTWVFRAWDDALSEEDEGEEDWLHDLFDLPQLPNRPIELI